MIIHTSLTKKYLCEEILRFGADRVLENCFGLTDTKILLLLSVDPRKRFVVGPCDNRSEDGGCAGHPPSVHRA